LIAAAQALLEVLVLRPGYGVGDETAQVRSLVALNQGRALQWLWAQGSLQRAGLWFWLRLGPTGLRSLHAPGLAALALETLLLWRLTRRWFSVEAAAWAVLADLLCAATWMRTRSILSHQWLPLELLLLACLAGGVKSRRGAFLWGAAGALMMLDYEGALAALPGLVAACLWQEAGLRKRWGPAVLGLVGAAAVLAGLQPRVFNQYIHLRAAVNWGEGLAAVFTAWSHNLGELLAGGRPMPYLGVDAWPAMAAWSLPLLGLGAWAAWKKGGRGPLLWALSAVCITQAATAPWGVPSQRLVAAWPALCMLAGLGGASLRQRFSRVPAAAWLLLLGLGLAAEANAFYRHMAFHGREVYGRAELLGVAARDARAAMVHGAAVSTALMETRSNDVRFFVGPTPGSGRGDTWVFLPPEFRVAAASAGRSRVYRSSANDVPVLVLVAGPGQASRFAAVESDLRPILDADSAGAESVWLARPAPAGDDWAYAAVLDRHLRRLWTGLPLDRKLTTLLAARTPLTPGPLGLLGRYLVGREPAVAVSMLDEALRIDPWWAPALESRVDALQAEGKGAEARAAAALRDERLRQGAWQVYD
jgi:hypothetical protein